MYLVATAINVLWPLRTLGGSTDAFSTAASSCCASSVSQFLFSDHRQRFQPSLTAAGPAAHPLTEDLTVFIAQPAGVPLVGVPAHSIAAASRRPVTCTPTPSPAATPKPPPPGAHHAHFGMTRAPIGVTDSASVHALHRGRTTKCSVEAGARQSQQQIISDDIGARPRPGPAVTAGCRLSTLKLSNGSRPPSTQALRISAQCLSRRSDRHDEVVQVDEGGSRDPATVPLVQR